MLAWWPPEIDFASHWICTHFSWLCSVMKALKRYHSFSENSFDCLCGFGFVFVSALDDLTAASSWCRFFVGGLIVINDF